MNVCILGGGNIGTVLLGDIASRKKYVVNLYTKKPWLWKKEIEVVDLEQNKSIYGTLNRVSDTADILEEAELILSTLPSNVFKTVLPEIKEHIKPGAYIGIIPGSGGCELCCQELIEKGCTIFGFQRVHAIARLKEYGKSVCVTSRKPEIQIGAIPHRNTRNICEIIEDMLEIPCRPLDNYLCVTLTPSNPILHTTRLYAMFREYKEGMFYDRNILFYEEWTDESSKMLMGCDEELQNICRQFDKLNLKEVKSLKIHYESESVREMTRKISGIKAFKGILSPMKKVEGGFIPDKESRYFKEDFLYGLCIIKAFAVIAKVKTPNIDTVLKWYEKFAGVSFFNGENFTGKDLLDGNIPQIFGLYQKEDVYRFLDI